jgi:hypothetical protein
MSEVRYMNRKAMFVDGMDLTAAEICRIRSVCSQLRDQTTFSHSPRSFHLSPTTDGQHTGQQHQPEPSQRTYVGHVTQSPSQHNLIAQRLSRPCGSGQRLRNAASGERSSSSRLMDRRRAVRPDSLGPAGHKTGFQSYALNKA